MDWQVLWTIKSPLFHSPKTGTPNLISKIIDKFAAFQIIKAACWKRGVEDKNELPDGSSEVTVGWDMQQQNAGCWKIE